MDNGQTSLALDSWKIDAGNIPRFLERKQSGEYINSLSGEELFERFGITRVGEITGFDVIGVPVYHVTRPAALVLTQNSGKGLSKETARTGAIGEGIEYSVFENPTGDFWIDKLDSLDPDILPLAKGSTWNSGTLIPLEYASKVSGGQCLFPSDLLWMSHRKAKVMHFMMTSNGQALGASFESAFLGGLYECIERDAIAIALYRWRKYGVAPVKVDLSSGSDRILELWVRIVRAGLKLYVCKTTADIVVPVYCAYIVDPQGDFFSTTGWGCDLVDAKAAEAAILEAIQARCVYIAGARDDLSLADYDCAKARDSKTQMRYMESLPFGPALVSYCPEFPLQYEIDRVLEKLGAWRENVYFKLIDLGELKAVKVVILGLESPFHELWQPSKRCISLAQACTG
jgi:YcaO-like protein with predicted kinase domain